MTSSTRVAPDHSKVFQSGNPHRPPFDRMEPSDDHNHNAHTTKKRRVGTGSKHSYAQRLLHSDSEDGGDDEDSNDEVVDDKDDRRPCAPSFHRSTAALSSSRRPSRATATSPTTRLTHGQESGTSRQTASKRSRRPAKNAESDPEPDLDHVDAMLPSGSDIASYVEGLSGDDEALWSDNGAEPDFGVTRHLMAKWREWYMDTLNLSGEWDNYILVNGPFARTPVRTPRMDNLRAIAGETNSFFTLAWRYSDMFLPTFVSCSGWLGCSMETALA